MHDEVAIPNQEHSLAGHRAVEGSAPDDGRTRGNWRFPEYAVDSPANTHAQVIQMHLKPADMLYVLPKKDRVSPSSPDRSGGSEEQCRRSGLFQARWPHVGCRAHPECGRNNASKLHGCAAADDLPMWSPVAGIEVLAARPAPLVRFMRTNAAQEMTRSGYLLTQRLGGHRAVHRFARSSKRRGVDSRESRKDSRH